MRTKESVITPKHQSSEKKLLVGTVPPVPAVEKLFETPSPKIPGETRSQRDARRKREKRSAARTSTRASHGAPVSEGEKLLRAFTDANVRFAKACMEERAARDVLANAVDMKQNAEVRLTDARDALCTFAEADG